MSTFHALLLLIHFCALLYVSAVLANAVSVGLKKTKDSIKAIGSVSFLFTLFNLLIFYASLFVLDFHNVLYAILYAQLQGSLMLKYMLIEKEFLALENKNYLEYIYGNMFVTALFVLTFV